MSLQDLAGGIAAGLALVILASPSIVDWSRHTPPVSAAAEPVKHESEPISDWASAAKWSQALAELLRWEEERPAGCPTPKSHAGFFATPHAGDYCPISDR